MVIDLDVSIVFEDWFPNNIIEDQTVAIVGSNVPQVLLSFNPTLISNSTILIDDNIQISALADFEIENSTISACSNSHRGIYASFSSILSTNSNYSDCETCLNGSDVFSTRDTFVDYTNAGIVNGGIVSNGVFISNSGWAIDDAVQRIEFCIIDSEDGIRCRPNHLLTRIFDNQINVQRRGIESNFTIVSSVGNVIASDNPGRRGVIDVNGGDLQQNGSGPLGFNLPVQSNGGGSCIRVTGANNLFIRNTSIEGGVNGVLLNGSQSTFGISENIFAASQKGAVINNSSDISFVENDLIGIPDLGVDLGFNSSLFRPECNDLNSSVDMELKSTINRMLNEHLGNCFDGDFVDGTQLTGSQVNMSNFFVDPNDEPCFLPSNFAPIELFQSQGGVDPCGNNPNVGGGGESAGLLSIPSAICDRLEVLNNLRYESEDPLNQISEIIDLINAVTFRYDESEIPSCINDFLTSTDLIGIQPLIEIEKSITASLFGSENLIDQMNLLNTIISNKLTQYENYDPNAEGNSNSQKAHLKSELFQLEADFVELMDQNSDIIFQNEEYVESVYVPQESELDSISLLQIQAYKLYSDRTSFSSNQQNAIISNAKLCSYKYGLGVNLFRALAATFSDEIFEDYDILECGVNELIVDQLSKRSENDDYSVFPNPVKSENELEVNSRQEIKSFDLMSINGQVVKSRTNISNEHLKINTASLNSGVYVLRLILEDGQLKTTKIVIE